MSKPNDDRIGSPLAVFLFGVIIAITGAIAGTMNPDAGVLVGYLGVALCSLAIVIEIFVIGSCARRILRALPEAVQLEKQSAEANTNQA